METFFKDSFETYKTFLKSIIIELERKVDVQNHKFEWVRFQNRFFLQNPGFERKFDVQNHEFKWVRFQNRFFLQNPGFERKFDVQTPTLGVDTFSEYFFLNY